MPLLEYFFAKDDPKIKEFKAATDMYFRHLVKNDQPRLRTIFLTYLASQRACKLHEDGDAPIEVEVEIEDFAVEPNETAH